MNQPAAADERARGALANVLRTIAYASNTSNLRHYLLTEALAMEGAIDVAALPVNLANPAFLAASPDSVLFRAQGTRLDPVESATVEVVAGIRLRDLDAEHTLIVRRGVIEYRAGRPERADVRISLDRADWVQIAGGHLRWLDALEQERIEVSPDRAALARFAGNFDGQ